MNDVLYIVLMIGATYAGGAAFVFGMMRVFFPLRSKQEWERISAQRAHATYQRIPRTQRAVMAKSEQLA